MTCSSSPVYTFHKRRSMMLPLASTLALGAIFGTVGTITGLASYDRPAPSHVSRQGTFREAPDCKCQYTNKYTNKQRQKLNKLIKFLASYKPVK